MLDHIFNINSIEEELFMAGAGFILVKYFNNQPKFLGLIGLEKWQKKSSGKYDIPKGTIDLNENEWDAAIRECKEETGIFVKSSNIIAGPMTSGFLTVWLAEVDEEPTINKNPSTGKIEHLGYKWLDPQDLWLECFDFLCEYVEWGKIELKKQEYNG